MSPKISAKRVVLTSLFVDLLDIILNIWVAFFTGSVVMIAELFQAIADLISSMLLWIGLKRSQKEIYFWTILSALVMLTVASTMSFYFGLRRFLHPEEVKNILVAYIALSVAAISNGYALFISVKRILQGKRLFALFEMFHTSPFVTTKNVFVLDLMGTASALTGLLALIAYQVHGDLRFDGLGAMCIGIILAILSTNLILNLRILFHNKKAVK